MTQVPSPPPAVQARGIPGGQRLVGRAGGVNPVVGVVVVVVAVELAGVVEPAVAVVPVAAGAEVVVVVVVALPFWLVGAGAVASTEKLVPVVTVTSAEPVVGP